MLIEADELYDVLITLHPFDYRVISPKYDEDEAHTISIPEQPEHPTENPTKTAFVTQTAPARAPAFIRHLMVKKEARKAAKRAEKEAAGLEEARKKQKETIEYEKSRQKSRQQSEENDRRCYLWVIRITAIRLAPAASHIRLQCIKEGETWCATAWEGTEIGGNKLGTSGKNNPCSGTVVLSLSELNANLAKEWQSRWLITEGQRVARAIGMGSDEWPTDG